MSFSISPIGEFKASPTKVADAAKLADNPVLRECLMVAYAELSWQQRSANDPQSSWAVGAKLEGARALIQNLLSLGSPRSAAEPIQSGKLEPEEKPNGPANSSTAKRGQGK